jgi:hypothetical protein
MYYFRLHVYLELAHNATALLLHYVTSQWGDIPEFAWSYSRIITILAQWTERIQTEDTNVK